MDSRDLDCCIGGSEARAFHPPAKGTEFSSVPHRAAPGDGGCRRADKMETSVESPTHAATL